MMQNMSKLTVTEIVKSHATLLDGTINYSVLARALGCSRQNLRQWTQGHRPLEDRMRDWYASGNPLRRVFAWEVLKSYGVDLPDPQNGNKPES